MVLALLLGGATLFVLALQVGGGPLFVGEAISLLAGLFDHLAWTFDVEGRGGPFGGHCGALMAPQWHPN